MKIKVTYFIPQVSVTQEIEVGNIKNNELTKTQSTKVDNLVKNQLAPDLYKKFEKIKPTIKIQSK